jgi:hygromycin-B 7''-O-kinase
MTAAAVTGPVGLPTGLDVQAYDELHDNLSRWQALVEPLAARHARPGETLKALDAGTVMVVLVGQRAVFKLYPPFLHDHFAFEHAALAALAQHGLGRFPVALPELLDAGSLHDSAGASWPWLLMSQLPGEVLTGHWAGLSEDQRCALLRHVGETMAAVHALPPEVVQPLARHALHGGDWAAFIAVRRAACVLRQQRTGLPAHLLEQVAAFVSGPVPMPGPGQTVLLTGEYTPMNLLVSPVVASLPAPRLSGMFDFGDGLLGAPLMDSLGPLAFLAAGHAARVDALLDGYGKSAWALAATAWQPSSAECPDGLDGPDPADWRFPALRLLLLHRYSHLPVQLAGVPGWQQCQSLEALAVYLWPGR